MTDEARKHVIESPLAAWPGTITLPHPDEFSGEAWLVWKKGVNKPLRSSYANMHKWAYAGIELVKAAGEWALEIPLGEVQSWETRPGDERTKLIAWLGAALMRYMDGIIDPKG